MVGVPHSFAAEWLQKRLYSLVRKTLVGIMGHDVEVQFEIFNNQGHPVSREPVRPFLATPSEEPASRSNIRPKLNSKYTFDNFVSGSCNQLAYAAAMGVAQDPGSLYNPLFIHSGVGLGKTHLLHAIAHNTSLRGLRALCVSAEEFTNEFIDSIRGRDTGKFRSKFRSPDLLLLDDVHFISGKAQTQDGLFHTFNELHNDNRQIVVTCSQPPRSIPMMDDCLCSRFEGGLVVDLQPPDYDTRFALIRAKATQQFPTISDAVLHAIASQCDQNIRELEGSLNRVLALAKLTGEVPTVGMVEDALCAASNTSMSTPTHSLIMDVISEYFHISPQEILGRKRAAQISEARQVTMYVIYKEAHYSLSEIGNIMGGRDHSTILQGCKKISTDLENKPQLREHLTNISALLSDRHSSP